jgi:hypothetical protein
MIFENIFGSKIKAQEIIYLLHDLKLVVRQGFYEQELDKVVQFCSEHKLFFVKSSFKIKLMETDFVNKAERIPLDKKGMILIYISKSEQLANLASYYELINNHEMLGLLLGYPSCCTNYFVNNFSENNPNPEIISKNPYLDISKRNLDQAIISHFPCSSDCQESVKLAQQYLRILKKVVPERFQELKICLKFKE